MPLIGSMGSGEVSGMIYLILHVIAATLFGLCYKIAERKNDCNTHSVHLAMYITSMGISIPIALFYEGLVLDPRLIGLGIAGGVCLLVAMRTFFAAMTQGGLAIGWTMVQMAVVVPISASIWIWGERPGVYQITGMFLMVPCLMLFSDLRLQVSGDRRRWSILVAVTSVATGLCLVTNKAVAQLNIESVGHGAGITFNFMSWMFIVGSILLAFVGGFKRLHLRSTETTIGAGMGILSPLATWLGIMALGVLPGIVYFPVKSVGCILLAAILAVAVMKEKLTPYNVAGIILGAVCALLVNIGYGAE